ncbi:MAG: hypothetical protein IJH28_05440 [Mogibacterium sp.]|nr:hypothetical protein [Mogibacterium sp.]
MAGTSLGNAYVQIVPTAEGIEGSIQNVLDPEAKNAGKSAGTNIVSFVKKALISGAIGKVLKDTIAEGARYEQARGGIETLFGAKGAKNVQEYADLMKKSVSEVEGEYTRLKGVEDDMLAKANGAWKTAGISANEYMEQTTSFAARLLKDTGGDTERAAELANMAILDMSDNANKFGTNIQDIQNAYQGFAKGNATMLDNLKLGYGGTQTEMLQLAKDMGVVDESIQSFSDMSFEDAVLAIHELQVELGIFNTTAEEAESTISGSFASMKAAASNFMAQLVMGEDLSGAMDGVLDSVIIFGKNILKALGNVLLNLPDALGHLGDMIIEKIQSFGDDPSIGNAAGEFIKSFALGLINNLPKLAGAALSLLGYLVSQLGAAVANIGMSIGSKIINAITGPFNKAKDKVKAIVDKIKGFFNFKVSTPKIPLPHFSITPTGWKIGDLLKGIKPSLSVKWYDKGGVFTQPSVIGVGERRPEFVGALDDLRKIVREESNGGDITINVYAREGMDVNALATAVEQRLIQAQKRRTLAWQ